jgi:protein-L-isoaspartate(D-aspartate) O-methyltransferase
VTEDARKIRLTLELRRAGIADTKVLAAIERVPRHLFVPQAFQDCAYENVALPIAAGQTISQPFMVASMIAALDLGTRMKVLEVGTGSGYQAAVLAQICRRVYTVERHRSLAREAERRFKELGLNNIVAVVGDGAIGWEDQAPFDRIIVAAAAAEIPNALVDQLRVGGALVMPLETRDGRHEVVRVTRDADQFWSETLMPARFVPLVSTADHGLRSA